MKFRKHCGQLSDSMTTQIEVHSEKELLEHINSIHKPYGFTFNKVKFEYVGFDDRINQETYYVCVLFDDRWSCIGMSDSDKF